MTATTKLLVLLALTAASGTVGETSHAESARRKHSGKRSGSATALRSASRSLPEALAVDKVPKPHHLFPVPTATRCIIFITIQYLIVYTALAAVRTYLEFHSLGSGKVEHALRSAAQTVTYGPMICVLFIAYHMRVDFLSDGKDQAPLWVQNCMYALTFASLGSTFLALVIPLVTGKPLALKEGTYDIEKPQLADMENKTMFYALVALRYLALLGIYGGLTGVIVGIFSYLPPGVTDFSKLPAPAPAVVCTTILAVVFFLTQLIIAFCTTFTELVGMEFPKLVGVMRGAASTVEFAPMLSILFLAARMRAMQHNSQPQPWAQHCMYTATSALILTTLLAIVVPLFMNGTMYISPKTKEVIYEVPEPRSGYLLMIIRSMTTICFYGSALGVAISIFAFEAPADTVTHPISPTVQCVVNLTCQFFFIYGCMAIMTTVSEMSSGILPLDHIRGYTAVESAKQTVALAPMLSILFVTVRMYALLITDGKGAPQAWVQDGMYMATWALFISFWACLMTGFFIGPVETDEDGNVVSKFSNKLFAACMTVLRYFTLLLLYGGICTVVVGLFLMTPETANGRGSIPLVSRALDSTPLSKPPPGPNGVA